MDDQELLKRWAAGDESAAQALVVAQMDRVHGVCASLIRDREVAAELSQEAILRLYRSRERFRGECAWSTWSYRIARNLCLNWLEKRREEVGDDGADLQDPTASAADRAADHERRLGVRAAIDSALGDEEREAVLLHYEAGLSIEEVTQVMGLTNRSGARGVLQRARRKLRKEVLERMQEDSIVRRAMPPETREQTLLQLGAARVNREPEVRTMRKRGSLLD